MIDSQLQLQRAVGTFLRSHTNPAEMKPKCLSSDIISSLPENVIETILCLVPIKDAVRTSILSSNWRYKWTKIPKLVFKEEDMFDDLFEKHPEDRLKVKRCFSNEYDIQRKDLDGMCKLFYATLQVLLLHQGPLREFTLSVEADDACTEIDQIVTYLSRKNTLKKLTLDLNYLYRLPSSCFLLFHQLTDLRLCFCNLIPKQRGFLNLTSLYLHNVSASINELSSFLYSCPMLKSFSMLTEDYNDTLRYDSSIYELFKYLPVVENMSLCMWLVRAYYYDQGESEVPQELPSALVHLKYLYLENICFFEKRGPPFLVLLIRCSPNLEELKLEICRDGDEIDPVTLHNSSDLWLEHLKKFEIKCFSNLEHELEFVKFILVKSPVLKKVSIVLDYGTADDEELILRLLVSAPRASPMVEISIKHPR